MDQPARKFWSTPIERVVEWLHASPGGLTSEEARRRLAIYGRNHLKLRKRASALKLLLAQFKSPLIIILLLAAVLSFFLGEIVDAMIIVGIVLLSGLLGVWQEKRAADAVEKLLAIVRINARAMRDGSWAEAPVEEIVPGDVVLLNAGNIIPGDCLIMESKDLFVDEAALTGESFPAEKRPGVLNNAIPGVYFPAGCCHSVGEVARRGAECFDPGCFPKLRRRFDDRDIWPGPIGAGNIPGDLRGNAQDPRRPREAALTASLLLRGFTLWLLKPPGLLLARRELS